MDLGEIGCCGVDWIEAESSCECDNECLGSINCWETIEWLHKWWSLE
jgi:hypothetical protein